MSYSFNNECGGCTKKDVCTDRASISGAISGIHQMPFGVGHLGSGTISLACHNLVKPEEEPHH